MADSEKVADTKRVDDRVNDIARQGAAGTFAVAGVATAIVVALYFAFYFFVYLPRGAVQ